MTWVAVAVGGGAIVGGLIQGNAAQGAASTQAQAAENAAAVQQNMFNTMYQGQTPYMQSGYGALNNLDYLMGVTPMNSQGGLEQYGAGAPNQSPVNYTMGPNGQMRPQISGAPGGRVGGAMPATQPQGTPGQAAASGAQQAGGWGSLLTPFSASMMQQYSPAYQYQLQQGEQGVLNGASASGQGALSGAAQMGLQQNNQALANTAFNNAFNQYTVQQGNIYQRLASIAQLGQGAASNQATGASTFAGGIGQAQQNVGTALAGGQVGAANAYAGALNNAAPWLMQMGGAGGGGGIGANAMVNGGGNFSGGGNIDDLMSGITD